ncbi:hypothetical protein K443DRAFT_101532, partial [Laccaria amethystina LaAM-08-1]
ICRLVSNKMESAKPLLKMKLKMVSPAYVKQWDVAVIMDPVAAITPTWTKVLYAASEPQRSESKDTRNQPTTRNIISSSVHHLCSLASCKVQIGLGLLAWTTGASHRMIDVLHQSVLSMSFVSITHIIDALTEHSLEEARKAVRIRPHALTYDNINLSTSIFVEQTANTPNKVQSGTFPVIYELLNAKLEDMKLEPIISHLKNSSPLKMSDLRPSKKSLESFIAQSALNVVNKLVKYVKGFDYLKNNPLLQHPERQPLTKGHKTKYHCLHASTIEEASVQGNILVHDDVYCQFQQLTTNSQMLAFEDFQISFGVFHLVMNLIWALLQNHHGTTNDIGSLSHYFLILEKTRLRGEHPYYHTLLSTLLQILDGLLLNAWRTEYRSLEDYAK